MNYFLLTSEYLPTYGGGIITYCAHTAKMLTQKGHSVTVIVGEPSLTERKTISVEDGVRVVRFRPGLVEESCALGREAQLSYDTAQVVVELIRSEGRPDVIESQEYLGLPYFLLQQKWAHSPELQGVPILLTLHTPQFICDRYNQGREYLLPLYWLGEMERFAMRAADGLISPSQYLLDELANWNEIPSLPRFVVRNPYQIQPGALPAQVGSQYNVEPTDLAFLGKLEPRKGILYLLHELKPMWDNGSQLSLSVIGGDHYYYPRQMWMKEFIRDKYKNYIEKDLLHINAALPPAEILAHLKQAKLVVFPSLFENYPYVVIEAMAEGLTVLASTSGGQAEMIEPGRSGFLYNPKESGSFANGLDAALTNGHRAEIGAAAQARIEALCAYEAVYSQKMEALEQIFHRQSNRRLFPFIRGTQKLRTLETNATPGLLSIVIPFYNAGQYLEDALASIQQSTWPYKEVIVVDDGSDEPQDIARLQALGAQYSVKLIQKTANEGITLARNSGAQAARGEFLAFIDADDTVDPRYFSRAIENLNAYDNVAFVGCWARYWGDGSGIWPAWNPEPPYILFHNMVVSGSLVFRRQAFLDFGLNDLSFEFGWEDYDCVLGLIENGQRGLVLPEALFNYRVRPDSRIHKIGSNGQISISTQLAIKHAGLYRDYGVDIAALSIANGPGYLHDNPSLYHPEVGFLLPGEPGRSAPESEYSVKKYVYLALRQALYPLYLRLQASQNPLARKLIEFWKRKLSPSPRTGV
jgi:glycosyltransferase involved in cell wall biosynthesis